MTIRYVGKGGSDAWDGLSWATRKLTLNGMEDTPVQAGDTIYIGPGIYRETLTVDVSGSSGNPITYEGDVTGVHTDGIGGLVAISGSNDDVTKTRSQCVDHPSTNRNYRTWRGIQFQMCTGRAYETYNCNDIIWEDCLWYATGQCIFFQVDPGDRFEIRRCIFYLGNYAANLMSILGADNLSNSVIENCIVFGKDGNADGFDCQGASSITIRNCTMISLSSAITANAGVAEGNGVYNCLFYSCMNAVRGGEFYVDYCGSPNIYNEYGFTEGSPGPTLGSNMKYDIISFRHPISGLGDLPEAFEKAVLDENNDNYLRETDDGNAPDHDIFGLPRSPTNGKRSWGAIQHQGIFKETTITKGSSPASLGIDDFGVASFIIPVMHTELTVSVYVYRDADYSGTLPQLIIKQPGQTDITITDTGAAGQWNLLTHTFVCGEFPNWIQVWLKSNNTATSGNYNVYFEDLLVE